MYYCYRMRSRLSRQSSRDVKQHFCQPFVPECDYVTFGSLLSQIRLSSVCNVRASYTQEVENFGNIYSPFCTLAAGLPLTSEQNFTEIVPGEPRRRRR